MAISLQKGQKIDLSKDGARLTNLMVGLGWKEAPQKKGLFSSLKQKVEFDIDASVLLLSADGKLTKKENIIYFGHKDSADDSVHHCGDNLVGGKTGGMDDSEQIMVDLAKMADDIHKVLFVVNIYDCVARKQHFGMVENAYIRIVDKASNETIASYNLTEDYDGKTTVVVGEIYKQNGDWKFNAIGQASYDSGLGELVNKYN